MKFWIGLAVLLLYTETTNASSYSSFIMPGHSSFQIPDSVLNKAKSAAAQLIGTKSTTPSADLVKVLAIGPTTLAALLGYSVGAGIPNITIPAGFRFSQIPNLPLPDEVTASGNIKSPGPPGYPSPEGPGGFTSLPAGVTPSLAGGNPQIQGVPGAENVGGNNPFQRPLTESEVNAYEGYTPVVAGNTPVQGYPPPTAGGNTPLQGYPPPTAAGINPYGGYRPPAGGGNTAFQGYPPPTVGENNPLQGYPPPTAAGINPYEGYPPAGGGNNAFQGYPPPTVGENNPLQGYPPPTAAGINPYEGYPPAAGGNTPLQGYPPPTAAGINPYGGYPPPAAGGNNPLQGYPPPTAAGYNPYGGYRSPATYQTDIPAPGYEPLPPGFPNNPLPPGFRVSQLPNLPLPQGVTVPPVTPTNGAVATTGPPGVA